jgi:hypothetical protein
VSLILMRAIRRANRSCILAAQTGPVTLPQTEGEYIQAIRCEAEARLHAPLRPSTLDSNDLQHMRAHERSMRNIILCFQSFRG